ncbi:hypothetical protein SteCoe_19124 [Stentor coeruleus]|uniref:Uncharacterized protein n=1 Tax=Stentor coeruleus TaxID=5963 RepID=A0A1R2BUS6_9CILI|nr:hypothetical protein SteCoe_19124 [Stentor coeruleus]
MNIFYKLFIFTLALKNLEASCISSKTYDLTFYIESSTSNILTCDGRSPVNAALTWPINGPPILVSIWDVPTNEYAYHCTMTEYFFIPAAAVSVLIDTFADNFITMKLNDVDVSVIAYSDLTFQLNKEAISYVVPGLNKLYIDVYNSAGPGYFGFRIKIEAKFGVS